MKIATFTLRADARQSARWKQASAGEGFPSVGAWAAEALDAYLEHRARVGRPIPLAWRRGRFPVVLEGGQEVTVPGFLSPPFAIYRGTAAAPSPYLGRHRHTLVHLPERRVVATLRTHKQAQTLAAELAGALLRRELPEPGPIITRRVRDSF